MLDPDQLLPTTEAAFYLGLSRQVLDAWRRRGIGPTYVHFPSAFVRDRNYVTRDWPNKRHGMIAYRIGDLISFIERYTVQAGRLPRPFAGRLPGGKNRPRGHRGGQ
jgi:hypothetical protein